jgi:hypothetical protein
LVASAGLLVGALVTTVAGMNVDLVSTRLLAATAGLGAGSPVVPLVNTVDGAGVSVAVLFTFEGIARNTAADWFS